MNLPRNEEELIGFLDNLEDSLEDLNVRYAECLWKRYTTGEGGAEDLNRLDRERAELLGRGPYLEMVREGMDRVGDPTLRRRLEVWEKVLLRSRVESREDIFALRNEITDRIISFRPVVGGKEREISELRDILRRADDRGLRREAWEAMAPLSEEMAPRTLSLIHARNRAAGEYGFDTFVDLSLACDDLDRTAVEGLLEELVTLTEETYRELLAGACRAAGLPSCEPWDLAYVLEGESPLPDEAFPRDGILDAIHAFLAACGLDPGSLPIEVHYYDIPFGGLCVPVRPEDIRILANPRDGHQYYATLFHEYGHALHAAFAPRDVYIFRRDPGPFSEGMAEVLGFFTRYPEWVARTAGTDLATARAFLDSSLGRRLYGLRSLAAQVRLEYGLYDGSVADPDRVCGEIEAALLHVAVNTTPRWAASPFPSGYPVYRQNYIIAAAIAAQTHAYLRREFGRAEADPEIFARLREVYWEPGARVPWQEKVRELTGKDLSAADLARELGGDVE